MKKIFPVILIIIFITILIGVKLLSDFSPSEIKIDTQWNKIDKSKNITFDDTEIFRDNVIFNWQNRVYLGSNSTSKTKDLTSKGEFFRLTENGSKVLELDKERNEMRFFQFWDCGDKLCIWGTNMNSKMLSEAVSIDLYLLLYPEKKLYRFSNPCMETSQIGKFNLSKKDVNTFYVEIMCNMNNSDQKEQYRTLIDTSNFQNN